MVTSIKKIKNNGEITTFDLFNLNNAVDLHPRSWISMKGKKLITLVNKIERRIIKDKNLSRESISRILSKKLKCSLNSFKYLLRGKDIFYPIPFIKEVVQICGDNSYLAKFKAGTEYLKVNSASSKDVKAVKILTPDLCKIIGAFMADGSLTITYIFSSKIESGLDQTASLLTNNNLLYHKRYCRSRNEHEISLTINQNNYNALFTIIADLKERVNVRSSYYIEITDEHKSNVESFKKWIDKSFQILPNSFKEKRGAWRLTYSSKILARYLIEFFDIIPGPKTYTAFEPKIIKKSDLMMRKLFARGVLMFDGCFSSSGKLIFSSKSRFLFASLKDILERDGLKIGTSINRGSYVIYTLESTPKEKIINYFEENTHKWVRVLDSLKMEKQNIENLESRYKVYSNNKVKFRSLYDAIREVKVCDWNYLSSRFYCSRQLLKPYLKVMANSGLIKLSKNPANIDPRFVNLSISVMLKKEIHNLIFKKIKEDYGTYKSFSDNLNIKNGTFSTWKLRKNRMPLNILKKICETCDVNYKVLLENIEETDRKIIEFI